MACRHPTNHAYLDRLTVPSDSIVWRPRRRPRTEARARRRDDHSGRLDITGPITEGRVLINAQIAAPLVAEFVQKSAGLFKKQQLTGGKAPGATLPQGRPSLAPRSGCAALRYVQEGNGSNGQKFGVREQVAHGDESD